MCLYTKSSHNVFALVVGCLHVYIFKFWREKNKEKRKRTKRKKKKKLSMLKCHNGEYGKSVLITLKTSDGSQVAHYLSVFKSVWTRAQTHTLFHKRMVYRSHVFFYYKTIIFCLVRATAERIRFIFIFIYVVWKLNLPFFTLHYYVFHLIATKYKRSLYYYVHKKQ